MFLPLHSLKFEVNISKFELNVIYIHLFYTLKYLITTDSAVEQKKNEKPWKDIQIPCRN